MMTVLLLVIVVMIFVNRQFSGIEKSRVRSPGDNNHVNGDDCDGTGLTDT